MVGAHSNMTVSLLPSFREQLLLTKQQFSLTPITISGWLTVLSQVPLQASFVQEKLWPMLGCGCPGSLRAFASLGGCFALQLQQAELSQNLAGPPSV